MSIDISERITKLYPKFSKGQKKIANAILNNYDKAASKLGQLVGVSESTVVRFAVTLGFDGYSEMQRSIEALVRIKSTPNQRIEITKMRLGDDDVIQKVTTATGLLRDDGTVDTNTYLTASDIEDKADLTDLAPEFDDATAYTIGQYVIYNGDVYRFRADHSAGAWIGTDATKVDIGGELTTSNKALSDVLNVYGSKGNYLHYQDDGESFEHLDGKFNLYYIENNNNELSISLDNHGYEKTYKFIKIIRKNKELLLPFINGMKINLKKI